jgi:SOS-response transcriptional repressor LexA
MIGLTRRQADTLAFIRGFVDRNGFSPNFDEIMDAVGMASKSNVHRLLEALEERGAIRRVKHRARSIEIVRDEPAVVHLKAVLAAVESGDVSLASHAFIAAKRFLEGRP